MMNTTTKPSSFATSNAITTDIHDAERTFKGEIRHAISLVSDAGRKVSSMIHTASDEISHVSEKATTEIRTNPVRSSLVALGAGFLIGALIRR